MAAVMQVSCDRSRTTTPRPRQLAAPAGRAGGSWAKAVHRIVTENISPEQAVDEAIARIKQILSE